ncbi:hypothetical protein ACIG56_23170 [Nocardia fusca]|uniref:hypothetical protein n=1 Tax=Nocardia fusca TaxID=941183 RepID=UPI0037CC7A35
MPDSDTASDIEDKPGYWARPQQNMSNRAVLDGIELGHAELTAFVERLTAGLEPSTPGTEQA